MKSCEINPINSDSLEIDCQKIYDSIIACQREFDGNLVFENNILGTLNKIEELLFRVNDIEVFQDAVSLILAFRVRLRQLNDQMKYIGDESIKNSENLKFIQKEMEKFKEII